MPCSIDRYSHTSWCIVEAVTKTRWLIATVEAIAEIIAKTKETCRLLLGYGFKKRCDWGLNKKSFQKTGN